MDNVKDMFRKTLLRYSDLENNYIEPSVIEEVIEKSTEEELEYFLKEDMETSSFSRDYIDFCSITVGILKLYGSMGARQLLKKHYK